MTLKIDVNKKINVEVFNFPDGQPHVQINKEMIDASNGINQQIEIICSITNPTDLFVLLQTVNAIRQYPWMEVSSLLIPYLMGARYDRHMVPGDSFDLAVVASMLDTFKLYNLDQIKVLDAHSKVSTDLLLGSKNVFPDKLVQRYDGLLETVLIQPDKGSEERINHCKGLNHLFTQIVTCDKQRDFNDKGRITLKVNEPERCKDMCCVIVDDLCDGGGTFIQIANQIQPRHLALIVTHGIFSRGLDPLFSKFDQIITTDSYFRHLEDPYSKFTVPENKSLVIVKSEDLF